MMSPNRYWKEKRISWKAILSCTAIWLLLVASFFVADIVVFDASESNEAAVSVEANRLLQTLLDWR